LSIRAHIGQIIPTKWHLSDGNGIVSNPAKFNVKGDPIVCGVGTPDEFEAYDPVTTPSGLNYQGRDLTLNV